MFEKFVVNNPITIVFIVCAITIIIMILDGDGKSKQIEIIEEKLGGVEYLMEKGYCLKFYEHGAIESFEKC